MDFAGSKQVDMKLFRQMYLVVSAIPGILLLLTFVLWFMSNDGWSGEPVEVPTVQYAIFGVLALATLPIALWVRRTTMKRPVPVAYGSPGAVVEVEPERAAAGQITMASVVGMAVPEVSLLLGFVLAFLTESWTPYVPFAAYAVVGWLVMYPRPAQVRAWLAERMGSPVPHVPPAPL